MHQPIYEQRISITTNARLVFALDSCLAQTNRNKSYSLIAAFLSSYLERLLKQMDEIGEMLT